MTAQNLASRKLPRTLEKVLVKEIEASQSFVLCGLRGCGKSSLIGSLGAPGCAAHFTNDVHSGLAAQKDPVAFIRGLKTPALLENAEAMPMLPEALTDLCTQKHHPTSLWLTFSGKLRRNVVTASRQRPVSHFSLWPFSIYELEGRGRDQQPFIPGQKRDLLPRKSTQDTWEAIVRGGMPGGENFEKEAHDAFFAAYFSQLLAKNIALYARVKKTPDFYRFLIALARRTGSPMNTSSLVHDVGLSHSTLQRWLKAAESCGLIFFFAAFWQRFRQKTYQDIEALLHGYGTLLPLIGSSERRGSPSAYARRKNF